MRFEREGRGWRRWGERLDGRRASKLIYGMLFGLDGNGLDGECAWIACLRLCNVHVITGRNDPSLLILCEERYVYKLQARNKQLLSCSTLTT